jgi:hypothetical protein
MTLDLCYGGCGGNWFDQPKENAQGQGTPPPAPGTT